MGNNVDISFSELRSKQVIDVVDGRNLGHVSDVIFSSGSARVKGIVAPYCKRGLFSKGQELFIPWNCIKNIGEDVIIVELSPMAGGNIAGGQHNNQAPCHPEQTENPGFCNQQPATVSCDRRCDKCMLYDCQFRWKGKVS